MNLQISAYFFLSIVSINSLTFSMNNQQAHEKKVIENIIAYSMQEISSFEELQRFVGSIVVIDAIRPKPIPKKYTILDIDTSHWCGHIEPTPYNDNKGDLCFNLARLIKNGNFAKSYLITQKKLKKGLLIRMTTLKEQIAIQEAVDNDEAHFEYYRVID